MRVCASWNCWQERVHQSPNLGSSVCGSARSGRWGKEREKAEAGVDYVHWCDLTPLNCFYWDDSLCSQASGARMLWMESRAEQLQMQQRRGTRQTLRLITRNHTPERSAGRTHPGQAHREGKVRSCSSHRAKRCHPGQEEGFRGTGSKREDGRCISRRHGGRRWCCGGRTM
jgi:hypothetical protein